MLLHLITKFKTSIVFTAAISPLLTTVVSSL